MKTNTKAALAAIMIMSLIAVLIPATTAIYPTTFNNGSTVRSGSYAQPCDGLHNRFSHR